MKEQFTSFTVLNADQRERLNWFSILTFISVKKILTALNVCVSLKAGRRYYYLQKQQAIKIFFFITTPMTVTIEMYLTAVKLKRAVSFSKYAKYFVAILNILTAKLFSFQTVKTDFFFENFTEIFIY